MIQLRSRMLCLDWDKRYVRILVAKVGKGALRLEDAHSHRIPPELDIDDPAVLGAFIKDVLAKHHIRNRQVIVDVPRDKAVIARLPLPPTPLDELPDVVRFQAVKELPFPVDEAAIDFVTLVSDPVAKTATEVLLTAVRRDVLERIRATCLAAGLTPARIGLRPYANLVALTHLPDMADKRVLFVDVGPAMTEINVIRSGALAFTRAANVSVPVQGDDEAAWESSRLTVVGGQNDQVIADAIQDLVVEVVRSLQAYRATESNVLIDNVVVAGGTGVETELAQALEKRLALATELFDPTLALGVSGARGAELRGFASVLGLAWGLGTQGLLELDFLNPKKVVRRRDTIIRNARMAGIAAAVVIAAGLWTLYTNYQAKAAELKVIQARIETLRKDLKATREIANRATEWDEWNSEAVWIEHLNTIGELLHDRLGKSLVAKSIQMEEGNATIRMDVIADRMETVTDFVKALSSVKVPRPQRATSAPVEATGSAPASDENLPSMYDVTMGTWTEGNTGEPGFGGGMQISIRIKPLVDQNLPAAVEARRKAREKRVKDL